MFILKKIPRIFRGWQPNCLSLYWHSCYVVCFQVVFSFVKGILMFSWFGSSIHAIICYFPLFIIGMAYFSMPNSIPISSQDILTACIRVINSFFLNFWQTVWYHPYTIVGWFFSCYFWSLHPPVFYRIIWLRHIIVIIYSNGDIASIRRPFSGFSHRLNFLRPLSVRLSYFSCYFR